MINKNMTHNAATRNKFLWFVLVVLFLIPLTFINIKNSHDWGDDFAMYLSEAKNMAEHKNPADNGFMINPNAMMGPASYPIGFPLMLAPLVKSVGLNFEVLNIFQSLILVFTLFFGFLFLSKHFSGLSSLFITLAIAYNPVILHFKTEILSDIPFWCLVNILLCLVYYQKNNALWMLLTGALIGFSIHVRSIGFAVLLSFAIYRLWTDFSNRTLIWRNYLAFVFSFLLIYVGLKILYPLNTTYSYFEGELLNTGANHLSYNFESVANFFKSPELHHYYFITSCCAYAFLTFTILGFFIEFRENPLSFVNLLSVIFTGVVVFYHYGDAGIRLILPILFIFFYYFAKAFKQVFKLLQFNYKVVAIVCCAILLACYYRPLQKIIKTTPDIIDGPCTPNSYAVFAYMKENGILQKNIGFDRPRALALFTNNKSVHLSDEYLKEEVKNYKLDYVLVLDGETSDAKKQIIYNDTITFKKVYSNAVYGLFKISK